MSSPPPVSCPLLHSSDGPERGTAGCTHRLRRSMEIPSRNTTPEKIKECLITFEDKHFYHHWGVNPFAIGRAFYQNVKNKRIVSGGSTLTMQTIRLARNESRTFREKLIEMIWATRLEFRASKEEILSMYISHAPFGKCSGTGCRRMALLRTFCR